MLKLISVKEKLPPVCCRVLVCREIRLDYLDRPILTHDIGMLEGSDESDMWKLDLQQYSPLPCEPTIKSGIITHWMRLPKLH